METTRFDVFMLYFCRMKKNMGRLIRYILIIHKLSGQKNMFRQRILSHTSIFKWI